MTSPPSDILCPRLRRKVATHTHTYMQIYIYHIHISAGVAAMQHETEAPFAKAAINGTQINWTPQMHPVPTTFEATHLKVRHVDKSGLVGARDSA